MTVTELRKELEALETEGNGACPVTLRINEQDGDFEYAEISTVRTVRADTTHAPDFDKGLLLALIE